MANQYGNSRVNWRHTVERELVKMDAAVDHSQTSGVIRVARGNAFFSVRDLADLSERDLKQLWRAA